MSENVPSRENPNVVLAHDWLNGMRGGERVLEVLCNRFPSAPIFTLFYEPGAISDVIRSHDVHPSFLNSRLTFRKNYRWLLPLFPHAVESLRLPECDLAISTSHCAAKGIVPRPGTKHICYCFTPMRYAWLFYEEYFGKNPAKRLLLTPVLKYLRDWDRKASQRVDMFVTLSRHVSKRIRRFYGREARVVYPPVALDKWTPGKQLPASVSAGELGDYDLVVSALVPYKKIDLAIEAHNKLGFPLKIVGTGPRMEQLKAIAKDNVQFMGWLPDNEILELYRNCRALIFPGEEDFGIVPVETQACGRPVIAYGKGGALETVNNGLSGIFFEEQTPDSLIDGVERLTAKEWNPSLIRSNAERFSEQAFLDGMTTCMESVMNNAAHTATASRWADHACGLASVPPNGHTID